MVRIFGKVRRFACPPILTAAPRYSNYRLACVCAVSVGWVLALFGAAQGGAGTEDRPESPEAVLASRGLQLVNKKYLLDSEAQAGERFRKAQPDFARLHAVAMRQIEIMSNDATLAMLNESRLGLIRDLDVMRIEIDSYPQFRNRWTAMQMAVYNQSLAMRNQLNSIDRELDTLRRKVPTPKERDTVLTEMKKLRESCLDRIRDLSEFFDSISANYRDLARDKDVAAALQTMKRAKGTNLQLGPSDEFRDAQRRLVAARNDLDPQPKKVTPRQRAKLKTAKKTAG